uniref:Dual specificity tyrosine-phosphorylation-regulated kinase 4-like n=1 Tax=Petromyzon marinus TaxID=7757 RepID=A0AAJ7XET3_PETMA|nr:dual specificity tyrosine-phosphorylation-regulated kinase 4-like [Petromyzon marinus]
MELYGSYLKESERTELLAMQEIWYFGLQNQARGFYNNGYDDEDDNYIPVKHEHLNFRYEVLKIIGMGGQGIVIKCLDHKTNTLVAVKILSIPLSGTLDDLIRRQNAEPLQMEEVKIFTKGILKCLSHLHAKKIIHGDLKPENILVKDRVAGTMKVTDFGHSFVEGCQTSVSFGTLMFMAPEGHLGYSSTCSADMWALGCTVAEMATGTAIFNPMNFDDQLVCCMEVLGLPPDDLVKAAPRRNKYFKSDKQPRMFGCHRVPGRRPLCMLLANYGPEFVDFISSCLQWSPAFRMTPEQALAHKWLQDIGTGEPGSTPAQPSLTLASAEKTEIAEESMEEKTESTPAQPSLTLASAEKTEIAEESMDEKTELVVQETREQKKKKRSRLARVGRAICFFFRRRLLCGGVSTAE